METLQPFLFWFLGGLTALSAIAVVLTQNIVRAATWLLFTLAGVSGLFFLLGADLVGAIQLLVYVGGTLVLVVFGVMLTAQGPFITMKTSSAEWAISAVAGLMLLGVLCVAIVKVPTKPRPPEGSVARAYAPTAPLDAEPLEKPVPPRPASEGESKRAAKSRYTTAIGQGLLGSGVGPAHRERGLNRSDRGPVRTNYLLPFEIVSVHLLVVLIGAAYLARAKRRKGAEA